MLELLKPFIVTSWNGRRLSEMPAGVKKVFEKGRLGGDNVNIAFFVLSSEGEVLRAGIPFVQPGYFRMDSAAMGADMVRQLKDFFKDLDIPSAPKAPREPVLPDITTSGFRVFLTFGSNKINHYRTPVIETIVFTPELAALFARPKATKMLDAAALKPLLSVLYPPAVMDGMGGFRKLTGSFTLEPLPGEAAAVLTGAPTLILDDRNATTYTGPLELALRYPPGKPLTARGTFTALFPRFRPDGEIAETVSLTAAFETRPA
ncbi:hypothetical protein [Armatimonas sp.]|uniref:hypothetical protein n=1 Tax=Armatimonas sp. TaxID=1872638 RepID=UPI00286AC720|nr:hypothetical protein [Armatimonas sp.]